MLIILHAFLGNIVCFVQNNNAFDCVDNEKLWIT